MTSTYHDIPRETGNTGPLPVVRYLLFFLGLSFAWIFLTDKLVVSLTTNSDLISELSTIKGWAYIAVSTLFWYFVLDRSNRLMKEARGDFADLYDNAPDMFFSVDAASGAITQCNRRLEEITGLPRNELIGMKVFDLYSPDEQSDVKKHFAGFVSTGDAPSVIRHLRTKDGTFLPVALKVSTVRDRDGKIIGSRSILRDVRDLIHAQESLEKSEKKFSKAFHLSSEASAITEKATGRMVEVNQAFLSIVGCSRDEAIGRTSEELGVWLEPGSRAKFIQRFEEMNGVRNEEMRFRMKDGTVRDFLVSSDLIELDGVECLINIYVDITERKRDEETIRLQGRDFARLLDISRTLTRTLDLQTVLQSLIEQATSLVELDTGALYTISADGLYLEATTPALPADFPDQFRFARIADHPHILDAVTSGDPIVIQNANDADLTEAETQVVRSRGLCTILYVPLKIEDSVLGVLIVGTVGGRLHSFTDTELELFRTLSGQASLAIENARLHRMSRSAEARYRTLFSKANEGLMVMTAQGRIVEANEAFAGMHGLPVDQIEGRTIDEFDALGKRTLDERKSLIDRIMSGEVIRFEGDHVRSDGSVFPVAITSSRIDIDGQPHFFSFHQDITERRRAEIERTRLENQLLQAQRLEAIGTLSSGIAHDFNNILSIITGNLALLEEQAHDPDLVARRLNGIRTATDRATHLVKQLLTFARKSEIERKPVQINDLLKEIADLLNETFPKTIEVHMTLADSLPLLNADPHQIHQVLLNLSLNARDAMPQGGAFSIGTRLAHGSEIRSGIPASSSHVYVEVSLKDSGTGMDESVVAQIFDPFFTTKGVGKGSGLGLPVALGIVERHGGYIDVSSRSGEGTEFRIYLPVEDVHVLAEDDRGLSTNDAPGGTETILLIEDEEELRTMAVEVFERKGYTVLACADGIEGVQTFSENKDRISLVVSDLGLPGLDGEGVFDKVRAMNPDLHFVLLTGFIPPERKSSLMDRGLTAIMHKPYAFSEVLNTVYEALHPDGSIAPVA